MRKRILAIIIAVLTVAGVLSSCSSDAPIVLFFAVDRKAGSFDPQIVSDATASIVVRNCFEGLLRKDENGKTVNGVAKKMTVSPDGLTYTFSLREDAVWHLTSNAKKQLEGKIPENFDLSVTAHDFVFALRRAVDPSTGAHLSYMLRNIVNAEEILSGEKDRKELGVRAKDRYTLEIKLKKPQSNFPEVLTEPVCMPCNETFFNACIGRYGTLIAFSLSNGPFYLSRFDDTSYRINKAADYVGEVNAVPDYVWLYVKGGEELIEAIQTNDYSGAVLSQDDFSLLKVKKSMTVTEIPNVTRSLLLNRNNEFLQNDNIRKAIAEATDTSLIAENGNMPEASGIVPASAAAEAVKHPDTFNEKTASESLKKGLSELEVSKISLEVLTEKEYEDTMRQLLQRWQKILGISINFSVKTVTAKELDTAVKNGSYAIAFYPLKAETDSAYEYFGTFTEGSPFNITGYKGENTEKLLSELYSGDSIKFNSVYYSLEKEIADANVIIPVWEESTYFVCTKNVSSVIYFSGSDKMYFHKATNIKQK